jgi:hypothetical protein
MNRTEEEMSAVFVSVKIDRDEDGEETGVIGIRIMHQPDAETSVEVELYHTSMYFEGYTFEQAFEAVDALKALFDNEGVSAPFTGDLSRHMEVGLNTPRIICGLFMLAGTNSTSIGGMATSADGFYLVRNGRILHCESQEKPSWRNTPHLAAHEIELSKH